MNHSSRLCAWVFLLLASLSFAGEKHGENSPDSERAAHRPIGNKSSLHQGVFSLEWTQIGEKSQQCLFFDDLEKNTKYRVRTSNGTDCEQAIRNCFKGEICDVKGKITPNGVIHVEEIKPRVQMKSSGAQNFHWKPVSIERLKAIGVTDPQKFSPAFEDSEGVIWGAAAVKPDLSPLFLTQFKAQNYCRDLGAELPTGYPEKDNIRHGNRPSDFVRLRKALSAKEVLDTEIPPNYLPKPGVQGSGYFWSSSLFEPSTTRAYFFDGKNGQIQHGNRNYPDSHGVRCVIRTR